MKSPPDGCPRIAPAVFYNDAAAASDVFSTLSRDANKARLYVLFSECYCFARVHTRRLTVIQRLRLRITLKTHTFLLWRCL